jgi:hypothetical protein
MLSLQPELGPRVAVADAAIEDLVAHLDAGLEAAALAEVVILDGAIRRDEAGVKRREHRLARCKEGPVGVRPVDVELGRGVERVDAVRERTNHGVECRCRSCEHGSPLRPNGRASWSVRARAKFRRDEEASPVDSGRIRPSSPHS